MLHGKKGFERIVWACKNVLNHAVTWLFYDFSDVQAGELPFTQTKRRSSFYDPKHRKETDSNPLAKHHPFNLNTNPQESSHKQIIIPSLNPKQALDSNEEFEDWTTEIYEWLSLISLESPRVQAGDKIDPFLSRYSVPDGMSESSGTRSGDMISLRWKGLIPSYWIRSLLIYLK